MDSLVTPARKKMTASRYLPVIPEAHIGALAIVANNSELVLIQYCMFHCLVSPDLLSASWKEGNTVTSMSPICLHHGLDVLSSMNSVFRNKYIRM